MHDTFLLNKISQWVKEICTDNNIKRVDKLVISVNNKSHVNKKNLYSQLRTDCNDLVGLWTNIDIQRDETPDQTAIIQSIQGEQFED